MVWVSCGLEAVRNRNGTTTAAQVPRTAIALPHQGQVARVAAKPVAVAGACRAVVASAWGRPAGAWAWEACPSAVPRARVVLVMPWRCSTRRSFSKARDTRIRAEFSESPVRPPTSRRSRPSRYRSTRAFRSAADRRPSASSKTGAMRRQSDSSSGFDKEVSMAARCSRWRRRCSPRISLEVTNPVCRCSQPASAVSGGRDPAFCARSVKTTCAASRARA